MYILGRRFFGIFKEIGIDLGTANTFTNSKIVICYPSGVNEVEKRAIDEATNQSGAQIVK